MTGIMKTEPLAANAEWAREVIERRKLRLFQSNVRREAEILILRQQIIRSAASKEDARRARGSATERVVPGSPNVRGRAHAVHRSRMV
jgi:hypothetical protein